jgi:hypothetical protein
MQAEFAAQSEAVVRLAHGSAVTQTPAGQVAPAGQASTGVQVQPFAANAVPEPVATALQSVSVV